MHIAAGVQFCMQVSAKLYRVWLTENSYQNGGHSDERTPALENPQYFINGNTFCLDFNAEGRKYFD